MADDSSTASVRSNNSSLPPTEPPLSPQRASPQRASPQRASPQQASPQQASPLASPQHTATTNAGRATQLDPTTENKRQQSNVNKNLAHENNEGKNSGDDNCGSDVDSSSLSSLSRTRTRVSLRDESTLRAQTENLNLVAARGFVTWEGDPDLRQSQRIDVFADIHWEPIAKKAFFKLRTSVKLKNQRRRRHVSLFLAPERISSLSLDRIQHGEPLRSAKSSMDEDKDNVENRIEGPDVLTLIFNLSRQGALVLPNEPLEPKNKESADTLAALHRLAAQQCFSVHIRVPRRLLGMYTRIRGLATEISRGGISSIGTHADITGLYRGHGAQLIEGDGLDDQVQASVVNNAHNDDDNIDDEDDDHDNALPGPPIYEEAACDSSKQSSSIQRGKKRRRVSSSTSVCAETPTLAPSMTEPKQPPPLYDELLPASLKHFITEALAAQERKFNKALADQEDKFREELASQKVEMEKMREDLERQYVYIDDAVEGSVGVNMEQTQETIMRSITRGQLRATIYIDSPEPE